METDKEPVQYNPVEEHDSCAIVASIRKGGEATHGNLKRTIEALGKMGHRSGDVQGESDGCGVLTDIPRRLWTQALESEGKPGWLSEDKRFFVGHLMIPACEAAQSRIWQDKVLDLFAAAGADVLIEKPGIVYPEALGRIARTQEPMFWQMAGVMNTSALASIETNLFDLTLAIEAATPLHIASLSSHSVIYKVRGSVETLYHYYPELRSRDYTSAITIGHARYSTNTATAFERVQPFSLLGHNGEINTISRLREQAHMLGFQLVEGGSDSQDLNRVLESLIHRHGFSLMEAMEIAFPPTPGDLEDMPAEIRAAYRYYRLAFGPFAQGPAAIVARFADECVFSVDAMGLRPLWFGETDKEYYFSSEKGVVPLDLLTTDPKPLAPGEKMSLQVSRDNQIEVLDNSALQRRVYELAHDRLGAPSSFNVLLRRPDYGGVAPERLKPQVSFNSLARASGWTRDDSEWVRSLGDTGRDPIASLGYDGPLAALSEAIHNNISDYFKETVAVVTNPAIDLEREQEHFSTEMIVGTRPDLTPSGATYDGCVLLDLPIVPGGDYDDALLPRDIYRDVATHHGTMLLEDLLGTFEKHQVCHVALVTLPGESTEEAVARLADESLEAVELGARVLVLNDESAFIHDKGWVDPHLAVAQIDKALRNTPRSANDPVSQRRNVGIVVRSAAVRNLHDLILLLGVGADAVAPYLLLETATQPGETDSTEIRAQRLGRALRALGVGLQKVTSTMGIHELRGYGRIFSSIGLSTSLAEIMGMVNYAGGVRRGLSWDSLDDGIGTRRQEANDGNDKLPREKHFYPAAGKHLRRIVQHQANSENSLEEIRTLEHRQPVAIRHIIGFKEEHSKSTWSSQIQPFEVDTEITGHSLPFVIASMSFGSQSEQAYRAYAEAAHQLNIIALNGEGGEIDDIMGKYPHNRGQQIASGRFGVTMDLLNASNLLEIKVGQGAKPGEGGHLPGRKVSPMVARARHVSTGIDLISPSNNHDIYSIEDLAQFIEELKTANPKARVAVKVPVVPGIGVISVGIAKAGADIINLTGYDGGTGAARAHSIKHVGLPAEIGLIEAQRALVGSGMRHRVEVWADGGVRTPDDVVKLMCLGANRVGFGTVALVALGCVLCRRCHQGDCPKGITGSSLVSTQDTEHHVNFEQGVKDLVALFTDLGREVKVVAARMGFDRLQDLVGRSNLLEQVSHFDRLDLDEFLVASTNTPTHVIQSTGIVPLRRPRNHLTTVISNVVMETMARGEERIIFEDGSTTPVDRALGTHLAGALTRYRQAWDWRPGHNGVGGEGESWRRPLSTDAAHISSESKLDNVTLRFYASSVPGNGLGAFSCETIDITVEGGAQDGVGKGMSGGRIVVLKGYNHDGIRIDGSVGKGLGYGATGGQIIIQGNADSRACVRLSGADVIIGGEISRPLNDSLGRIGARANVKGFLCEYMTAGRVLVLGDPGPWICAGMTGGILYARLQPELNFDWAAIQRRLARGARVEVRPLSSDDHNALEDLITMYADELHRGNQQREANAARALLEEWETSFVKVVPRS